MFLLFFTCTLLVFIFAPSTSPPFPWITQERAKEPPSSYHPFSHNLTTKVDSFPTNKENTSLLPTLPRTILNTTLNISNGTVFDNNENSSFPIPTISNDFPNDTVLQNHSNETSTSPIHDKQTSKQNKQQQKKQSKTDKKNKKKKKAKLIPSSSPTPKPYSPDNPTDPNITEPIWHQFANERNCSLNETYYQQIYNDLEIFYQMRTEKNILYPITKEMLEFAKLNTRGHSTIITIEEKYVRVETDARLWPIQIEFFQSVAPLLPVGLSFILNLEDGPLLPDWFPVIFPVFSACKFRTGLHHRDIIIPSFVHYYAQCWNETVIPWESEEKDQNNTVFWRGSSTGTVANTVEIFKQSSRYKLVAWGQNVTAHQEDYPYRVDIGFSALVQHNVSIEEELKNSTHFEPMIPCMGAEKFKYLVIVDGNAWVQRFQQFLRFESLLFYHPNFIEWYTPFVIPNKHYIWVEQNFSDLDSKLRWAIDHEEETIEMVKETSDMAQKHLRIEDQQCYFFRLLQKYAELVEEIHEIDYKNKRVWRFFGQVIEYTRNPT